MPFIGQQVPIENDPSQLRNWYEDINEQERLRQIMEQWDQNPGLAPNGTGPTGLNPNDSKGWARSRNDQTWASNALRGLQNQGPLQMRGSYAGSDWETQSAPLNALQQMRAHYLDAGDVNHLTGQIQDARRRS